MANRCFYYETLYLYLCIYVQLNPCNSNPQGAQNLFELHEFSNYRSSSFFRAILLKKTRGCIVQAKEENRFFFYEKYLFFC